MTGSSPLAPLPDRQLSEDKVQEYRDSYVELFGFVPPRVQARADLLARLDPALLAMQEQLRRHCMYPPAFDLKTSQLMVFGMLLVNLQDAARTHAIAAYRAGATLEELSAVVNLAFLFRGFSAANYGAEILQGLVKDGSLSASKGGSSKA